MAFVSSLSPALAAAAAVAFSNVSPALSRASTCAFAVLPSSTKRFRRSFST
jgi:hypothetical protein